MIIAGTYSSTDIISTIAFVILKDVFTLFTKLKLLEHLILLLSVLRFL